MLFGKREGRFAALKAMEESLKVKRYDVEALCKVILASESYEDEKEEAENYLMEAEPIILKYYGRFSLEYARFLSGSAKTLSIT